MSAYNSLAGPGDFPAPEPPAHHGHTVVLMLEHCHELAERIAELLSAAGAHCQLDNFGEAMQLVDTAFDLACAITNRLENQFPDLATAVDLATFQEEICGQLADMLDLSIPPATRDDWDNILCAESKRFDALAIDIQKEAHS